MLFPEEDAPLLKAWIVKRLENTSDADPEVLADYVLALLRHDVDAAEVRKICETDLPDFLGDDTNAFISDVFNIVAYKAYRPGAPPPPPPPFKQQYVVAPPPSLLGQQLPMPTASGVILPPPQQGTMMMQQQNSEGLRKRSFHEDMYDDMGSGRENMYGPAGGGAGGRSFKQPRRGRGAGRGGRGAAQQGFAPFGQFVPGMFDPAIMESIMKMHQMGIPIPAMPGFDQQPPLPSGGGGGGHRGGQQQQQQQQQRKKGKCRDYENKGYCTRGNACMFEHGDSSIYVPGSASDEYNPNQINILDADTSSQAAFPSRGAPRDRGRGNNARGQKQRRGGGGSGGRAPFSAEGPEHDKTKSTVVIENIPEENFAEDEVRAFFSQFGAIEEVSMRPYKRLAVVKFGSWSAANAAYRSPKVIFDNRFVKVFWYKDDDASLAGVDSGGGPDAGNGKDVVMGGGAQDGGATPAGDGEEPLDMEEFKRRQEEAQRLHEEKAKKKQEVERQRHELEKRQRELLAKQQEEKQKLYARIAAASGGGGGAQQGEDGSAAGKKPASSQTEALRAQLAALEEEAKQLGIDPSAVEDEPSPSWGGSSYRGGRGRGRGAGYYSRGRGGASSFRGGGRGGAGAGAGSPHQAYAAYSLDNRPRRVAVSGVDFSAPERDEALRQYLLAVGDYTDISTAAAGGLTEITFRDRKTAEKFFYGLGAGGGGAGGGKGKSIPGVEGVVEVSWVAGAAPQRAETAVRDFGDAAAAAAGGSKKKQDAEDGEGGDANGDVAMDDDPDRDSGGRHGGHGEGANGSGGDGGAEHGDRSEAAVEMDYDVAAEEDFDIG